MSVSLSGTGTDALSELRQSYRKQSFWKWVLFGIGFAALFVLILVAVTLGAADLTVSAAFRAVVGRLLPFLPITPVEELVSQVIWNLRLPRIVMAVAAGAGLAVSGVVMQGILRNPLVSPFTLGISSAAAFGASIAIMFGIGFAGFGSYIIVGNAFVFALLCALLVFGMSWLRGMTPETMILTGIALMYLFSALTATLQFIATEQQLAAVVQWTFGTLNGASWNKIGIVAVVLLVAMPVFMRFAWPLNAMASGGEEVAKGLGIQTGRVRIWSSLLSVLVAAAIISFTGVIGFVGLVAPHIARLVIGGDHRYLIPYSALFGAILLLSADTIGRSILSPAVIPVGIVVSYLGVPLFIQLILTRRKEYFQ